MGKDKKTKKITTEQILNLDCTNIENVIKLNRFLYRVPTLVKYCTKEDKKDMPLVTVRVLEKVFNDIQEEHGYFYQFIKQYYEDNTFHYHYASIAKRKYIADGGGLTVEWKGNVYGKDLWELYAKAVIKIYADIVKERKEMESNG